MRIAANEGEPQFFETTWDSCLGFVFGDVLSVLGSYLLRKPASWIVAVCEQSEYKGVWGEGLPKSAKISLLPGGKGGFWERFSGSCTMRQKGDGRVSIPPRSAFWGAFWGAWQRSRCLREGGRSASTDRKEVRVKAPFATAVDVGGGRTKVARLEGLCRALWCQMGRCLCEGGRRASA